VKLDLYIHTSFEVKTLKIIPLFRRMSEIAVDFKNIHGEENRFRLSVVAVVRKRNHVPAMQF
jgi:hypothetical protein